MKFDGTPFIWHCLVKTKTGFKVLAIRFFSVSLPTVKGKTGVIAGAIIFKTANLLFGKVICLLENLSQLSYSYKTSLPAVVWFYMWCGVASRVTTS